MIDYQMTYKEIEQDVQEQKLNLADGWSAEELARLFAVDAAEVVLKQAEHNRREAEGPNFFLVGGPYPNYS